MKMAKMVQAVDPQITDPASFRNPTGCGWMD
jgi:hypothetical protein